MLGGELAKVLPPRSKLRTPADAQSVLEALVGKDEFHSLMYTAVNTRDRVLALDPDLIKWFERPSRGNDPAIIMAFARSF